MFVCVQLLKKKKIEYLELFLKLKVGRTLKLKELMNAIMYTLKLWFVYLRKLMKLSLAIQWAKIQVLTSLCRVYAAPINGAGD